MSTSWQPLTGEDDFETGVAAVAGKVPVLVATKGEAGAIAIAHGERAEVTAEAVEKVVDTTGAGDQFAAGFLSGYARGEALESCLKSARHRSGRSHQPLRPAPRGGFESASC